MKEVYGIKKVTRNGEEKSFWTRIGIAHECKDGSLNCFLDYVPAGENITLNIREPKQKENKGEKNHDEPLEF
jgi:hypothetical protein